MNTLLDRIPVRAVLVADGAACLAMGVALLAARHWLATPTGLSASFLMAAGGVLLPIGVIILALALPPVPSRDGLRLVVVGNVLWVAASLAVVTLLHPTAIGTALVLAQAVAVAGLAWLESRGLRGPAAWQVAQ